MSVPTWIQRGDRRMTTLAIALLIGVTLGLVYALARRAFDAWQWHRARRQVLREYPELREWT